MSNTENVNERRLADDPPGEPLVCSQVTPARQLLRLQGDIEELTRPVAMAINPIVEALCKGRHVSYEMLNHLEAHILRAHLQLDELEELLEAMASRFQEGAHTQLARLAVLEEPEQPANRFARSGSNEQERR
jgi:hypothetical protein